MDRHNTFRKQISLVILVGFFWASSAVSKEYQVIDLSPVVGASTYVDSISDKGVIVGRNYIGEGFVWRHSAKARFPTGFNPLVVSANGQIMAATNVDGRAVSFRLFQPCDGSSIAIGSISLLPKSPYSHVAYYDLVGFNSKGQAAFNVYDEDAQILRGAAVMDHGVITTIPTLDSAEYEVRAYGINERGQVVGYNFDGRGQRGYIWKNGTLTDLGLLGGTGGGVSYTPSRIAINNKGQVAGTFTNEAGVRHAFLWQKGVKTDLGTLGGTTPSDPESIGESTPFGSSAVAINDKGQVIGYSITATGERHAFLWKNGVMTDLGTLGGNYSTATAINQKGQIIGYASNAGNAYFNRPFLWSRGKMIELKPLPGWVATVLSINNKGWVVGLNFSFDPNRDNSVFRHATLWKPTREEYEGGEERH